MAEERTLNPVSREDAGDQELNPGGEYERISRRAYERFQERGAEHGRDEEDWLEAEREINSPWRD